MSIHAGRCHLFTVACFVLLTFACGNVLVYDDAGVDGGDDPTDAATDAPVVGALVLSTERLAVDEGATATFTVALAAPADTSLTVMVESGEPGAASVTPAQVVFPPGEVALRTITVVGTQDVDAADEAVTITLRAPDRDEVALAVDVADLDTVALVATPGTMLEATEGGTAPLLVRLSAQPASAVTVTAASSNPAIATVAPATLTFTPQSWNVDQAVTVTAVHDVDTATGTASLTLRAGGLANVDVSLRVIDDDVLGIQPSTTNLGQLTEGGTRTFDVRLSQQPSASVTVAVASADAGAVAAAPATLTFTPATWNQPQIVTASASADADAADESTTITLTATGLVARTIAAAVDDDDVLAIETTAATVTLAEEGGATFGIRLTAQPPAAITVTVTSSDPAAAMVTSPLTFTTGNWNQLQTVAVTGVDDLDLADETVTITAAAAGLGPRAVQATIDDNDIQMVLASPPELTLTEGTNSALWVKLAFIPAGPVTVTLQVNEPTVAKLELFTLTFTPANFSFAQEVGVNAPDDVDGFDNGTLCKLTAPGAIEALVEIAVTDDDQ